MEAKKSVKIFISLVLGIIVLFLTALYIYDPLQVFHKTWRENITFHKNMRQQAAGIINNYKFDSIILGTSMLENTSANEASKKLDGSFVNISIPGGNFYERSLILKYTLKKKNIKKVLYSLDGSLKNNKLKGHKKYSINSFNYLYDENMFNDFNVYMNNKYLNCLRTFSNEGKCIGTKINFDRLNAWYDAKWHIGRFGGLENWFNTKNNKQINTEYKKISNIAKSIKNGESIIVKDLTKSIVQSQQYIDMTIMNSVKKYPNTEFILVLPPYSRITYSKWAQYDKPTFEIYTSLIKHLVEKTHYYENLKIFGWGNHPFIDNIENYKDPLHFEYKINSWMLDAINREEGLLTNSNISDYLNLFTQKSLNFDLITIGEKIDNYLQDNN